MGRAYTVSHRPETGTGAWLSDFVFKRCKQGTDSADRPAAAARQEWSFGINEQLRKNLMFFSVQQVRNERTPDSARLSGTLRTCERRSSMWDGALSNTWNTLGIRDDVEFSPAPWPATTPTLLPPDPLCDCRPCSTSRTDAGSAEFEFGFGFGFGSNVRRPRDAPGPRFWFWTCDGASGAAPAVAGSGGCCSRCLRREWCFTRVVVVAAVPGTT